MANTVKCECGAEYEVTYESSPFRDSDNFKCEVCGRLLDEWNSTRYPVYRRISYEPAKPDCK